VTALTVVYQAADRLRFIADLVMNTGSTSAHLIVALAVSTS
jgi:hypothetical protein